MKIKHWIDEKLGLKNRKILDQAMHFTWALAALLPVLIIGGFLGGALSGLLLALPRELVDQWPVGDWKDTILDLSFFALGGAIAGLLFSTL